MWLNRAEEDLDAARFNLNGGRFPYAAFLAQQAAEKALKSMLIANGHPLRKTHDLLALARQARAPPELEAPCDVLNPHYVEFRYPTGLVDKYEQADAEGAILAASR